VTLRGEVIDLVRLLLHEAHQVGRVRQIAVVQRHAHTVLVRITIEMIDALGVEQRGTTFDAVHVVAFSQQQFGEIGAVLAGNSRD
jgi:hypothetical protein